LLVPSSSSRELLESASKTYAAALVTAPGVVRYLMSRGLSKANAVSYRLGYVAEGFPGHEKQVGRLSIPYLTRAGAVTIRFRRLPGDEHPAKYMSLPGDEPRIYNPEALFCRGDILAVCEGEFDAITLDALVGIPCIGIAGAQAWKPHFARLLEGYRDVVIVADGDEAGEALAERIMSDAPQCRTVSMPQGQDANAVYISEGADTLRKRIGL
jgi:DNA primase